MALHPRNNAPLRDARATGGNASTVAVLPPKRSPGKDRRAATRAMYASHLRSTTSRHGDTYSARTIEEYVASVDKLGIYLTRTGFADDFDQVDVATLNTYLAGYRRKHTQGGTNTQLRRLRPFFGWLEAELEAVNPYRSGKVAYYAPSEPPPAALGHDFLTDLLRACTGKAFEDVRDTAILRMLMTGVRRGELQGLFVEDIDFEARLVRVVALKEAKRKAKTLRVVDGLEQRAGRLVPIDDATMFALHRWLRIRAEHKLVKSPDAGPLWYATRGRGRLTGNGILRMVKRRGEEAGYDPATVNAHAFRHTRAHELLHNDVTEGDVMAVMGWKDRTMLDRYAANLKSARAIEAVRRAGLA